MASPEHTPRSTGRRLAAAVAIFLVALVLAVSAVFFLVDQEAVASRVMNAVLPKVSESLGRKVTAEGAAAKILPNPHVTLRGLTVHSEGGDPPLIETQRAEVDLALWPLIRSFGKEVRVQSVQLVRPEVNLLRDKDGNWNYEGLGGAKPEGEGAEPAREREVLISQLRLEDGVLRIIDRSTSHGEATIALLDIDATVTDIGPGEPLTVVASAAFANGEQNLQLDLSMSELPESFKGLTPGEWPELKGMLSITHGNLAQLEGFLPAKLARLMTGGTFNFDAELSTTQDGRYRVEGDVSLQALRLRGEPANGSVHLTARIDPAKLDAPRIELDPIALKGPGIDLGGSASISGKPLAVEFALKGERLDLKTLLGVMPEEEAPPPRTALLPAPMRRTIEGVAAHGTLQIDKVTNGDLTARDLDAEATLARGVLTLHRGRVDLYDGQADVQGTTVDLTRPLPKWNLRARLQKVDLGKATADLGGDAYLQGKADASLNLTGEGSDWATVRSNLTGGGAFALEDGALTSADLGARLTGTLSEGLRKLGKAAAAEAVEKSGGRTPLQDLRGAFSVKDGWLVLREPMAFTSQFGAVALDGRIGLDQTLDLTGRARLSPQFVAQVAPPQLTPRGAVDVPLAIGGTLKAPALQGPPPQELARNLIQREVKQQTRRVEDEVKRQARRRLGGVLDRLGGDPK